MGSFMHDNYNLHKYFVDTVISNIMQITKETRNFLKLRLLAILFIYTSHQSTSMVTPSSNSVSYTKKIQVYWCMTSNSMPSGVCQDCKRLSSSGVTTVYTTPELRIFPMRPVRPAACKYSSMVRGA